MNKSIRFLVSGRVQGVFFRASTKAQADKLELSGWVRNCENDEVEGVASGTEQQLGIFIAWLQQGPKMAKVDKLEIEDCDFQVFSSFDVR
ncbi:MAG: acylphosphatase [Gammaproteobacteria bacterium]|jgi:acylphosphatase|nr:acylphosphatase [Gammaproteobacteria bacterium]